jgi:predicted transcriptional regulator
MVEEKTAERLNVLAAAFSAYRETIAERYISREVMREVEDRLSAAIENLARTSAAAIDRLGDRLDQVADTRRRHT